MSIYLTICIRINRRSALYVFICFVFLTGESWLELRLRGDVANIYMYIYIYICTCIYDSVYTPKYLYSSQSPFCLYYGLFFGCVPGES